MASRRSRGSVLLAVVCLAAACGEGEPLSRQTVEATDQEAAESNVDISSREGPPSNRGSRSNLSDFLNTVEEPEPRVTVSIEALPGVFGFPLEIEFRVEFPQSITGHPAVRLAAEAIDRTWAENMERAIREAIAVAVGPSISRLDVVCRTTMCGVLFVVPRDTGQQSRVNEVLRDLGFVTPGIFGGRPGIDWRVTYGRDDRR